MQGGGSAITFHVIIFLLCYSADILLVPHFSGGLFKLLLFEDKLEAFKYRCEVLSTDFYTTSA